MTWTYALSEEEDQLQGYHNWYLVAKYFSFAGFFIYFDLSSMINSKLGLGEMSYFTHTLVYLIGLKACLDNMTHFVKINYFLIVLAYLVKLFVGQNDINEKLSKNTLGQ